MALRAVFPLTAPPLTGAGATWTGLVRKARRDFQPEFSTIRFNRKLDGKTTSSQRQEKFQDF
jgi:hypothetical protein